MLREYKPLLDNGFKEIALWQLDEFFLNPFGENERRKYLIGRLKTFIEQFLIIGINAEIWIDGSFATEKSEPLDIDLVFLLDRDQVDNLEGNKAIVFSNLMDNEQAKIRYSCDVYFFDAQDHDELSKWKNLYGFDRNKINSKGIFVVKLKIDV